MLLADRLLLHVCRAVLNSFKDEQVIVWKTNFDSEAEEEPENKPKKKSVGRPASARPGSTRPASARSNRPATASGFRSRKAFSEQTNTPEVRTLGPPIAANLPDPQVNIKNLFATYF